jgi:hypothetical protein
MQSILLSFVTLSRLLFYDIYAPLLLQRGYMGGGFTGGSPCREPSYCPWLYDPDAPAGQRFTVLACSNIKRLYHATSMLMPDGAVLITGSEADET